MLEKVYEWGYFMDVNYDKFFQLIKEKGYKKTEFAEAVGISQNTMANMGKNMNVALSVLAKICRFLGCTLDDIVEVVDDVPNKNQ